MKNIVGTDYCVFVMHRQENLLQSRLVHNIVNKAIEVSKRQKVVFILHQITYNTLVKLDLLKKLFPLKQCKTPKFKDRPCIYYQIGRCMAPCQKMITSTDYKKLIKI